MTAGVRSGLLIGLGALLLMVPALLNGFPFIFPDTTDYLTIAPQLHRPPFYGLLILFAHGNSFIWGPVILQSLLASHLIWLLMRVTLGKNADARFLLLMLGLACFTSLPFFTGFLIADIFTPLMFLGMYLLYFHAGKLSRPLRCYIFLLTCVATVTHISNLFLGIGLFVLFLMLRRSLQHLWLIAGPILLSLLATLLFYGILFGSWTVSGAGQSFLLANLIEYGPARHYLHEACPEAGYKICAEVDRLPPTAEDFLWYTGMFQRLGGFPAMKQESAAIVRATIAQRPMEVLQMVLHNFLRGLVSHDPATDFTITRQTQAFKHLLGEKFGDDDVRAYEQSAQMRSTIPHGLITAIDRIVTPASFLILLLIAVTAARQPRSLRFTLATATLCFLLGNTLLCTALSGVHDRYQSRVAWLAPLVVVLLLMEWWRQRRSHV